MQIRPALKKSIANSHNSFRATTSSTKASEKKAPGEAPFLSPSAGLSGFLATVGGQAAAAATGGNLTRAPACDPFAMNNGGGPPRDRAAGGRRPYPRDPIRERSPPPKDLQSVNKDSFIIPQRHLERFLPDGITVGAGDKRN